MTNTTTRPILASVRDLMPSHAICLGRAYLITEQQATKLLKLLRIKQVPVDVGRFGLLPGVSVRLKARADLQDEQGGSGRSKRAWEIEVCKDDPLPERRHHFAREIKRILDRPTATVVYKGFHCDDERHFKHKIESLQDYFADCLLVPRAALRRLWAAGLRDIACLAQHFRVPVYVLERRVRHLRLVDHTTTPAPADVALEPLMSTDRRFACDVQEDAEAGV